jgi:hypothetical protein
MMRQIEISALDLRYESFRMRHSGQESRLLASIHQRGIELPLEGVDVEDRPILLNGFKRYRCARQLHLGVVPYVALGQDEAMGIITLLRQSNQHTLSILEQARFVEELKSVRQMSVAEIALELSVSKAWVSMRLGLMSEMSQRLRVELFKGAFPVYSYMYTLRGFMRMNGIKPDQIEQFVLALSGKKLSVRDIEQLAHGFFRGPESFRQEVLKGNLALPLQRIKDLAQQADGCSDFEQAMLGDLEITQKYMQRVMGKSQDERLKSRAFHAQSHLLTAGILSRKQAFYESVRQLHDRNGQA